MKSWIKFVIVVRSCLLCVHAQEGKREKARDVDKCHYISKRTTLGWDCETCICICSTCCWSFVISSLSPSFQCHVVTIFVTAVVIENAQDDFCGQTTRKYIIKWFFWRFLLPFFELSLLRNDKVTCRLHRLCFNLSCLFDDIEMWFRIGRKWGGNAKGNEMTNWNCLFLSLGTSRLLPFGRTWVFIQIISFFFHFMTFHLLLGVFSSASSCRIFPLTFPFSFWCTRTFRIFLSLRANAAHKVH